MAAPSAPSPADTLRSDMSEFWKEHSAHATIEEMMLDSEASAIHVAEGPEVVSLLPNFEKTQVLEVGAGIGRFTSVLAEKAQRVVAVDFMESFIKKNEEVNGKMGNIEFYQRDATKMSWSDQEFDVVFTNWLMMYFGDEEVAAFAENTLRWCKTDGHLFFRESCRHQSGNANRKFNPTKYREPEQYTDVFSSARVTLPGGDVAKFELVTHGAVQAYITHKNNPNQMYWLWKRVVVPADQA